ncbi:MAG: flagellar hook-length control protein FliK [Candidatus Azotimanducaceae bacterium]|jgi:flagellar hook-length control protein FliK
MDALNVANPASMPVRANETRKSETIPGQGYAQAAEQLGEKDKDGHALPEVDGKLPVSNLDKLQSDLAVKEKDAEFDESELISEAAIASLPATQIDLRLPITTTDEKSFDVTMDVSKGKGINAVTQNASRAEVDLSISKQELSLMPSGAREALISSAQEIDTTDKRLLPVELKNVSQQRAELSVPVKVGDNGFQEGIAQRVMMLISQRNTMARIHINPADLGPVEVRLNVNHDQASVQFLSHSSQVRDALEQSIPRLRDMLEAAGLELADSHVGDQDNSGRGDGSRESNSDEGAGTGEIANGAEIRINKSVSDNLLDAYA